MLLGLRLSRGRSASCSQGRGRRHRRNRCNVMSIEGIREADGPDGNVGSLTCFVQRATDGCHCQNSSPTSHKLLRKRRATTADVVIEGSGKRLDPPAIFFVNLLLHRGACVEDVCAGHTKGTLEAGDRVTTLEGPRIAAARHYHSDHALVTSHFQKIAMQSAAGACGEHLENVTVQERKDRLGNGLGDRGSEGQELRPRRCEEQLGLQASDEWSIVTPQTLEDGAQEFIFDLLQHLLVNQGRWGEGAHAVGDRTSVLVVAPPVVLRGRRDDAEVHTVAEGQDGHLGSDLAAVRNRRRRRGQRCIGRQQAQFAREALGEGPGVVEFRGGLRWAEGRHPGGAQGVGEALVEQLLGADDCEDDGALAAKVLDLLEVRRCERHVHKDHRRSVLADRCAPLRIVVLAVPVAVCGVAGDAGIARRYINAADLVGLAQLPGQCMLAATVPDDQHRRLRARGRGADTVASGAAALEPEHEGSATDLRAAGRREVAGEVPIAGMLGHGLVQGLHGVEEHVDLRVDIRGRQLLHDLG
mmetsp:Transcript_70072/g.200816  ORF Transcript_70072/g.200816 Transcript_70072/m.200816 type:complete len:527 (-) Transcript_70072:297-1877(-)